MGKIAKATNRKPEAKSKNSVAHIRKTEHSPSINTSIDRILFLQRTIGNQAVQRLIRSGALQAKLRIGQPGDIYEQEADRVADTVIRMPEPQQPRIQSVCHGCEKEKEEVRAKTTSGHISEVDPNLESRIQSLKGGGRSLSDKDLAFFEPRFGQDFRHVRIHTGAPASEMAQALNAMAFTVGKDIVFGAGKYAPGTSGGKQLLAHELTHVVQQNTSLDNRTLQCQAAGPITPAPCDQTHIIAINTALSESRNWRRQVLRWLDDHLNHIRRAAPSTAGQYNRVGPTVLRELRMLDRHFKINNEIRNRGSIFPMSADERGDVRDFENFGNSSYDIRRHFSDVELGALNFQCQVPCPRGRRGSDTLGSAVPGSLEITIYTHCFDGQHPEGQAGVVLHEAFHATFSNFDHDTYSFESGYPGSSPLTNADSFANFASIIANGHTYRIIILPPVTITGSPD